jgi:hypothetical protein
VAPRTTGLLFALFAVAGASFAAGLWALAMRDDWMALVLVGVGAMALRAVWTGARALERGAR